MLTEKRILEFLRELCEEKEIPFERADDQFCAFGDEGLLCVPNPDAPESDGLANDIDTLMLPTLRIQEQNGKLVAVETEYTKEYLYGN